MLLSIVLLTQTLVPVGSWTADDYTFDKFGPRVDEKVINIYPTRWALMMALQTGAIDVAGQVVPSTWEAAWSVPPYSDPSSPSYIKMMPVKSIGMREFDLNHRQYLPTQPAPYTNPMTYQRFRRAIAHLTNKPNYVAVILGGRVWCWARRSCRGPSGTTTPAATTTPTI